MRKPCRKAHLALFLAVLGLTVGACSRHATGVLPPLPLRDLPVGEPHRKLDPVELEELQREPGRRVRALVDLSRQVDLERVTAGLKAAGRSKSARRAAVVGSLERVASSQQAQLAPLLDRLQLDGEVDFVRRLAIVNRLLVEGSGRALLILAERPEVWRIRLEWTSDPRTRRQAGRQTGETAMVPPGTSWAVESMGVRELWKRGYDGSGVVVGIIDTGVYAGHEQLRDRQLRGGRGWYDPRNGSVAPEDNHGHGTGVLSVAVGRGEGDHLIGMAPGAQWAAALGNWRNFYSTWRMSEAADWMLRVARPDVLLNAWSHDQGHCNAFDRDFIAAWKAAEIFVVFPAGNRGPDPRSGETPASLSGTLSVAAVADDGQVHAVSSRGPSDCGNPRFPSLAAPGADVPAAALGGPDTYTPVTGTSISVGIVGGVAALLLSADPELSPRQVEDALLGTARDLPPPGHDPATGSGVIVPAAALARVLEGLR